MCKRVRFALARSPSLYTPDLANIAPNFLKLEQLGQGKCDLILPCVRMTSFQEYFPRKI